MEQSETPERIHRLSPFRNTARARSPIKKELTQRCERPCPDHSVRSKTMSVSLPSSRIFPARFFRFFAVLGLCTALIPLSTLEAAQTSSPTAPNPTGKLQFNRDVRPILSDLCFQCHGPDNDKRKANLRLDDRASALHGGKSGEAGIVPGQAEASEIIKRILSEDEDEHMPPKKGGKRVRPEQLAILKRWISEGAEYQGHWAFSPVQRPTVPAPATPNPIDAFIRSRLDAAGLKPSPQADKGTLLRRLSLDLTGLPPTSAELEAFLADPSPKAYENALDRLLQSPHFGEQMALQWLDFARYADSNGFQSDGSRQMFIWRDWVIGAFNGNMPFNQFTIEQLAGDLLPNAATDQIIATGFNRNHRLNGEGGRIEAEWFVETVIDRVETTGNTWLGLSVGCARCHDHKFDPISQKEFYQLFAFFNSCEETGVIGGDQFTVNTKPILQFPSTEHTAKLAEFDQKIAAAKKALEEARAKDAVAQKTRESRLLASAPNWTPLRPSHLESKQGAQLSADAEGVVFSGGTHPVTDTYVIGAETDLTEITGLRLELIPDPRLPSKGSGRHGNGNPVVSEIRLSATNRQDGSQRDLELQGASADFSQKGWDVTKAIDGNPKTGWAIHPEVHKPHAAFFRLKDPIKVPNGAALTIHLDQQYGSGSILGKFRLSVTGSSIPEAAPEEILTIVKTPASKRTEAQRKQLAEFYKSSGGGSSEVSAKTKLDEITKAKGAFERTIPSVMVMQERAEPRPANFLIRGQYDRPGDPVQRGVPAALPPLPEGAPMNRLGLAQWIVSENNPLTARVWVNRAWEKFFGMGIVKSSENFGSQSDWPSYPELLDWLAAEFMRPSSKVTVAGKPAQPWDMKALLKLIALSDTYQQSSKVTPVLLEKDPDNRLLARGPRSRLSGETLRDCALRVSGLMAPKIGGPSVRPYMPKGVWDETSVYGDLLRYQEGKGEDLYRRTLYTIWKRTAAPPTALLFDAPNREVCTVKRSRTNTPLQALALLNEVTFVEAARKLAERMLLEGGATPEERIRWAFRCVTCRTPEAGEVAVLVKGLQQQLDRFQTNPDAARELLAVGASPVRKDLSLEQLAAYTLSANVLLNLDEFITH